MPGGATERAVCSTAVLVDLVRRLPETSIGDDLLEERRRSRRAGDPRLTDSDREILRRLVRGDLGPISNTSARRVRAN